MKPSSVRENVVWRFRKRCGLPIMTSTIVWKTFPTSSGSVVHHKLQRKDRQVQQLQKKVADLERQMRSRSPRGRNRQLALPASSSSQLGNFQSPAPVTQKNKSKGKGRGKGKSSGKSEGKSSGPKQIQTFQQLIKMNKQTRPKFTETHDEALGVCYSFQEHKCNKNPCTRPHVCIGRGKGVPYNDCRCLSA